MQASTRRVASPGLVHTQALTMFAPHPSRCGHSASPGAGLRVQRAPVIPFSTPQDTRQVPDRCDPRFVTIRPVWEEG